MATTTTKRRSDTPRSGQRRHEHRPREGPEAQTFGDGCAEVPADGAGSFDGMVNDPVATAASNNPLLTTLVTAVGAVDGLGDTLNGAEELTVFAPFNGAFAEIPEADLNALVEAAWPTRTAPSTKILAHHVVGTNADTEAVAGEQETLAGDTLTIEGDENGMTVGRHRPPTSSAATSRRPTRPCTSSTRS